MIEEKMYAIRNNVGKYLTVERTAPWWDSQVGTAVRNIDVALAWAGKHGGHVVTFNEEPEKVVLSKEEAKIVEDANKYKFPASYISMNTDDCDGLEKLLMNAYVNGYTVANEKKYLVYKKLGGKQKNKQVAQAYRSSIYYGTISWILTNEVKSGSWARFTEAEIEQYGLQDCEKEEVTDDE